MDAAFCGSESVGSDMETRPSLVVPIGNPASSDAAPVSVRLNGVTVVWGRDSIPVPDIDELADLWRTSCLRRHRMKAMVPATRIKAATPPTTPPAIAPVCDVVGVALAVIWTTGALRT